MSCQVMQFNPLKGKNIYYNLQNHNIHTNYNIEIIEKLYTAHK